jgi:hypothetical protein
MLVGAVAGRMWRRPPKVLEEEVASHVAMSVVGTVESSSLEMATRPMWMWMWM